MLVQGLIDANYQFLDVYVRWLGSVNDASVFTHSALYNEIENDQTKQSLSLAPTSHYT